MRNACFSPVSMDPAPSPALVALSSSGAALTGLPCGVVRSVRNATGVFNTARVRQSGEKPANPYQATGNILVTPTDDGPFDVANELQALAHALTGTSQIKGSRPFAACYGGHQFGNWVGQLGDGRVATLGEIRGTGARIGNTGTTDLWNGHLIEVCWPRQLVVRRGASEKVKAEQYIRTLTAV